MISCSTSSLIACSWFIASSSNISHVFFNLLRVQWIDCMFVKFMNRWLANFLADYCICSRFSIEINCLCLLIEMRFVRNHILAMKHLYEYNENFFRAMKNKNDWFFRLDVLETIYDFYSYHEFYCNSSCEISCDNAWWYRQQNSSQKTRRCYVFCSLFIVYKNVHYAMWTWSKMIYWLKIASDAIHACWS